MAGINQGSIIIDNSITNPNSDSRYWIDNNNPISFFDFLKHINRVATPVEFNDSYNNYLHNWYKLKGESTATASNKVRDRYVDLLRDISINFTTAEEKRFLNNIDFNNPQDLLIAVPFYSQKIAEICQFYTKKREQVKYKIEENKIKGTKLGIEKNIFNTIVEYIFTDDQDDNYRTTNAALSSIIQNLDIEIEEMFDTYSEYFNIDGDLGYENYDDGGDLRNTYFTTNNIIESSKIGDLFLNFEESLKKEIFSSPVVIDGFSNLFSVNIAPSFSNLLSLANIEAIAGDNFSRTNLKLELKRRLLEKYIGTDIYYLSASSTSNVAASGILFRASEPSKNLLNARFASTATIPSNQNKTIREIGSFFTPDKLGILHFKTGKHEYRIRQDYLEPGKVYIFPDPEIYGNISNITDTAYEYPLYCVVDNSQQVKDSSFTFTANDVYNTSYDQLLYAYSSKQERYNKSTKNTAGLNSFNFLYNKGIITDWHQDIFGNEYGLVKNVHTNKKNISYTEPEPEAAANFPNYIVFDGYLFRDGIEGYNFNYSVSSGRTFNNSIRTGITSRTIDEIGTGTFDTGYTFASGGMFALTASPVRSLYFREFDPYIEAIYPDSYTKSVMDGELCDGASFTYYMGAALEDPFPAGSPNFNENASNYYYNTLLEAGLDNDPSIAAVLSGEETFFGNFPLSAINAEINDGGSFLTNINISNDYPYINKINFYAFDNTFSGTLLDSATGSYTESTIQGANNLAGIVFVRDVKEGNIYPLSALMSSTFFNLPSAVRDEIYTNKVQWINIYEDTLVVQTNNYYVIERIVYKDQEFVNSNKPNIYYLTNQEFSKFSKPFFIKERDTAYFCKMTLLSSTSALNNKALYPEIYEYNIANRAAKKIYPGYNSNLSGLYSLSGLDNVNITTIKQPEIVYNTRNNIISVTLVGEDGNGLGYIFNYKYKEVENKIQNISAKIYRLNTNAYTHNFYETTLTNFVSSSTLSSNISINSNQGILFFN